MVAMFFSSYSFAISKTIDDQTIRLLSESNTWRKLLLYEYNISGKGEYTSAVLSDSFFLSESGKKSPYLELRSTIQEFSLSWSEIKDNDKHPICKFPARAIWLNQQYPDYFKYDTSMCTTYNEWSLKKSTESISIVFATGYLGNPASFFGHTLIKFNSGVITNKTKLSDVSINYGAIIPDNENPIEYIFKGLTGGYDAGFTSIDYYFHNHNYGENELRDMWEYELDFSSEEIELILAHAWSLLGKKYTYYFLLKNCAYRMAELFEIIDGVDFKPQSSTYLAPQELIQKLYATSTNSGNIVKNVKFHPSRQSRFYSSYNLLNDNEKKIVFELIDNNLDTVASDYRKLPEASQKRVTHTLLDYYYYLIKKSPENKVDLEKSLQKVLVMRFNLPIGKEVQPALRIDGPHLGRRLSYTSVSIIENSRLGRNLGVRFRPAYYDSLDSGVGHIDSSVLSMGEVSVMASESSLYIDYLNLFSIESINSKVTGLPGDSNFAWNLKAGLERYATSEKSSIFRIQGDIGKSYKLDDKIQLSTYMGLGINDKKGGIGKVFVRGMLKVGFELSDSIRGFGLIERKNYIDSGYDERNVYKLVARYEVSRNTDLRFSYVNDGSEVVGFSLGMYW